MTQPFFPCFEDSTAGDSTSDEMRAQLRSWYQWIPDAMEGEANLEIRCPDRFSEGGFIGRAKKAVVEQLQAEIAARRGATKRSRARTIG